MHKNFKSKLQIFVVTVVTISCLTLNLGCSESKEEIAISKAQQCLNVAQPSTVDTCSAMVSSYQSEKAYLIRCSADYIRNNFIGSRIAQAFENIQNKSSSGGSSSGSSGTLTVLALMAFTTMEKANQAVSDCQKSGVQSLMRLASISQMATFLATFSGLTNIPTEGLTADELKTALSSFDDSPENLAALGGMVVNAEPLYCSEGSKFKSTDICTKLSSATATGSVESVASSLLDQLKR